MRRHRAHAAAQKHAESQPRPEPPDHPLICAHEPELIADQQAFERLIDRLRTCECFAYDTEFIGETSYFPRLCLVQVATADFVALIDPLSLENLVAKHLDVQLPKALTFTRWDQRPLSDVHVHYAVDDVRYLLAVRRSIVEKLEQRGRLTWAEQEFEALTDIERYRFDARAIARRLRRMHNVPLRHRKLLLGYVTMRDRIARQRDLPPRSIIRDKLLVDLAREAPDSLAKLRQMRGLPAKVSEGHGRQFVDAAVKARASKQWQDPPEPRKPLPPEQRERVDHAWKQLKAHCEAIELSVGLVTARKQFGELATQVIREGKLPDAHPLLVGWRKPIVEPIVEPLRGG